MSKACSTMMGPVGSMLVRVSLGLYFAWAGVNKVGTEISEGLGTFANGPAFTGLTPKWLPDFFANIYGYTLPWVEVIVGVLLMVGLVTRISALLTFMMLVSFVIVLVSANGISGGSPGPFHTNFILAAVALMFILQGGGKLSVDSAICCKSKGDKSS